MTDNRADLVRADIIHRANGSMLQLRKIGRWKHLDFDQVESLVMGLYSALINLEAHHQQDAARIAALEAEVVELKARPAGLGARRIRPAFHLEGEEG